MLAKINITYNGQNADLQDEVYYDLSDHEIKTMVTEALQSNTIVGISSTNNVDLSNFVVERFTANDSVPYNRIMVRPKTAYGV